MTQAQLIAIALVVSAALQQALEQNLIPAPYASYAAACVTFIAFLIKAAAKQPALPAQPSAEK